jgi:hypothetical protein
MNYSTLKIIFFIAVFLTMLSAPIALEIAPDGNAFAFGSHSGSKNNGGSLKRKPLSKNTNWSEYKTLKVEKPVHSSENLAVHPVPEPATMLLVGGGLAGIAMFRKKFKK